MPVRFSAKAWLDVERVLPVGGVACCPALLPNLRLQPRLLRPQVRPAAALARPPVCPPQPEAFSTDCIQVYRWGAEGKNWGAGKENPQIPEGSWERERSYKSGCMSVKIRGCDLRE